MIIKQANISDLPKLRELYDTAKHTMNRIGNQNQWKPGEPFNNEILDSIDKKQQYLVVENDEIVATFVFFIGNEPAYDVIEAGSWPNNEEYGALHRIASNGKVRGVLCDVFTWAAEQIPNLRIDTHRDNAIMHHSLNKYGFKRCGLIHLKNGEERIAYAKVIENWKKPCDE